MNSGSVGFRKSFRISSGKGSLKFAGTVNCPAYCPGDRGSRTLGGGEIWAIVLPA